MLTPLEVQKKEFGRSLRGFSERDVNEFLLEVAETLEKHINHVASLNEHISRLEADAKKYRAIESTLSETLVVAKKASDDLVSAAKSEAHAIVHQAELEAKSREDAAHREVLNKKEEYSRLEKDLESFRLRIEAMLKAQLGVVENYSVDLK